MLNTVGGNLSNDFLKIVGATGNGKTQPFFKPIHLKLGKQWMIHQFLHLPNLPKPLLEREFLEKLNAEIKF